MKFSERSDALVALLLAFLPISGMAQDHNEPQHDHDVLEEIVVTATPLNRDIGELAQSATVLQGESLRRQLGSSIGETLAHLPGLSDASFGQNLGRPVIRGLQGARVGVRATTWQSMMSQQ